MTPTQMNDAAREILAEFPDSQTGDPIPLLTLERHPLALRFTWIGEDEQTHHAPSTNGTGIDFIINGRTGQLCGFDGTHMNVKGFLQHLKDMCGDGPYKAAHVVETMEEFCAQSGKNAFGAYQNEIVAQARKASMGETPTVLLYFVGDDFQPITGEVINELFPE